MRLVEDGARAVLVAHRQKCGGKVGARMRARRVGVDGVAQEADRLFQGNRARVGAPAIEEGVAEVGSHDRIIRVGEVRSAQEIRRNYLAHTQGDAINVILAAAGYNFSLLLR